MTKKTKMLLNLNNVDQKTLVRKLEISAEQAKRILDLQPYRSIDQLNQLSGLDTDTLARILPLVAVEENETERSTADHPSQEGSSMESNESDEKSQEETNPSLESEVYPAQSGYTNSPEAKELTATEELPDEINQPAESENPPTPAGVLQQVIRNTSLLLILILLVGAYFRFTGVNWDQNQHQHPDERFITMVSEQIRGVTSIEAYFDTATSTLNPLRFGSYTYGMLPLFLTRLTAEWAKMATYDKIPLVGRVISGIFDLAAVWMLYLLGSRLYDRRIGILAAALGAAAVLPIQLSHFFAVDSFSTVFVVSSMYFALLAVPLDKLDENIHHRNLFYFLVFGALVGLAGACKVSVLPIFGAILVAGIARLIVGWKKTGFGALLVHILSGWVLAGLATALFFRIFQPYAFTGPGFFGMALNQEWLKVLREVTNQVAGLSEWPPNHQWTNQPITYAWVNMVLWGMGLPLGLAGWAGWTWAGWRMWKGDWRRHLLPFAWVLGYFIWQNIQFWRYMRYFLPIYPFVILFAAWALVEIFDRTSESRAKFLANGRKFRIQLSDVRHTWQGAAGILAIALIVTTTYVYAFAFSRIYTRPITRIEASQWMLENIPAPLNLKVQSLQDTKSYPLSVPNQSVISTAEPGSANIYVTRNGISSEITSTNIRLIGAYFYIRLSRDEQGDDIITEGRLAVPDDSTAEKISINFGNVEFASGQTFFLQYKIANSGQYYFSDAVLRNDDAEGGSLPIDFSLKNEEPGLLEGTLPIQAGSALQINHIEINNFRQVFIPNQSTLEISLYKEGDDQNPLAVVEENLFFSQPGMQLAPTIKFDEIQLIKGKSYKVRYQMITGGPIRLQAADFALETSWDDSLPLNVDQKTDIGSIYHPLNLQLFDADTPEKREAMIDIIASSDYIVMPSNRAYDAMPRLPLRYPLALKYYQTLFDCDCSADELENRAYNLRPPFKSPLGFDLVQVFQNDPSIGPFTFPDQYADESFTVYDHPKVFIFKKSSDFSIEKVKEILYSVDLEQVIFQVPLSYTRAPTAIQLTPDRLAAQTAGGTWSSMFSRDSLLNTNQNLAVLAWWAFLLLLGWSVFPLVFTAFSGLPDRGYPLARMAGLIIIAWLAWIVGSNKILAFTRLTIELCIGFTLLINIALAYFKRQAMAQYLRAQWKHILVTEILFLGIFLLSVTLRTGNPDLWQPWMGGEKPMDFAFFNATLKAVYFPPENPWFSGHYINYYYYGYVIAAIPTKLLGILPSIAYNLILPAWFTMTGIGVFSVAFNLVAGLFAAPEQSSLKNKTRPASNTLAYLAGIIALVAIMFLGNLYMVRQFWHYLPEALPSYGGETTTGSSLGKVVTGAIQVMTGQSQLPGDKSRWYFGPSRPILHDGPDTPIAEFPYFTFLFADLHAHLLAMPVYGLALGWMLGLLLIPLPKMKRVDQIISLLVAGLVFGSLRAIHTWDFPTFTGLGALVILWNIWQTRNGTLKQTLGILLIAEAAFLGITIALYQPFAQWFNTEYVSIELWQGLRTPLVDYLFVFGLFLFVMTTLLVRDLAPAIKQEFLKHPAVSWRNAKPFLFIIPGLFAVGLLWVFNYQVLSLGIPLLAGMVYLVFLKRDANLFQKVTWLVYAIAIAITLLVEIVVLKGDVGRSNTVFRYYNQAWFFFGIATSLALIELSENIKNWRNWQKAAWGVCFGLLIFGAASYSLVATPLKMADRWPNIPNPPITLDGAAFMLGDTSDPNINLPAIYNDDDRPLDLSLDYAGIQFMQENVIGSPVIVEGHTQEYRWGSRYSIHTGLPSVLGWSWHTRQHNSLLDGAVFDKRRDEVDDFYNNPDIDTAKKFLGRYHVQYVILGGLERLYYSAEGLDKFQVMVNQGLLKTVFGNNTADTATIFEVLPAAR